ncbi:hypothetical protein ABZ754_17635 [Micromonospora purpureochromogenes]|uniref:hypothetical protein n=1 Tax=Micromonospora purpureochromogenes TaxID=47872 RepID=UPI003407D9F4
MKRILRRAGIAAVIATVVALIAPTTAFAVSNLPNNSALRHYSGSRGTGVVPMYNSSNQKIGEYSLEVDYWYTPGQNWYNLEVSVCVWDRLANGRGVIARVLMKYGSNSSKEVGKFKASGGCTHQTVYPYSTYPLWAVDVDFGEDWSGTPYQYAGNYDRYTSERLPYWPYFGTS